MSVPLKERAAIYLSRLEATLPSSSRYLLKVSSTTYSMCIGHDCSQQDCYRVLLALIKPVAPS